MKLKDVVGGKGVSTQPDLCACTVKWTFIVQGVEKRGDPRRRRIAIVGDSEIDYNIRRGLLELCRVSSVSLEAFQTIDRRENS